MDLPDTDKNNIDGRIRTIGRTDKWTNKCKDKAQYTVFELGFCGVFALIPCKFARKISSKRNRNWPCDKQF